MSLYVVQYPKEEPMRVRTSYDFNAEAIANGAVFSADGRLAFRARGLFYTCYYLDEQDRWCSPGSAETEPEAIAYLKGMDVGLLTI